MKRDLIAPEFEVRFLIEAGRNGMEFKWDADIPDSFPPKVRARIADLLEEIANACDEVEREDE